MATDTGNKKGDVQAALDELGRRGQIEYLIEKESGEEGVPVALLPKDFTILSLKSILDEYLPTPERKRGTVQITEVASLCEYINLYKQLETLVYVDDLDKTNPEIEVVFDEHVPAQHAGEQMPGTPNWRQFRATYAFPITPEWKAWTDISNSWLSQAQLAIFLEDHVLEVLDPSESGEAAAKLADMLGCKLAGPAKLLEVSRKLAINVEQQMLSNQNLTSGEVQFKFEEKHTDAAGGQVTVPGAFAIGVPVFRGGATYRIPVRLKYRMSGGKPVFLVQPHRMDVTLENAIEGVAQEVRTKCAVTVVRGRAGD